MGNFFQKNNFERVNIYLHYYRRCLLLNARGRKRVLGPYRQIAEILVLETEEN
jgi:hypothetical protein